MALDSPNAGIPELPPRELNHEESGLIRRRPTALVTKRAMERFNVDISAKDDTNMPASTLKLVVDGLLEAESVAQTRKKIILGLVAVVVVLAISNIGSAYIAITLARQTLVTPKNELTNKENGRTLSTIGEGVTLKLEMTEHKQGENNFCIRMDDLAHLWHGAESGSKVGILSEIESSQEGIDLVWHGAVQDSSSVCFPTSKGGRVCIDLSNDACTAESGRHLTSNGVDSASLRHLLFQEHLEAMRSGVPVKELQFDHLLSKNMNGKENRKLLEKVDISTNNLLGSGTYFSDPDVLDVVIVGSGWAGLGAATHLLKKNKNLDISILEANNYIGGRSTTDYFSEGKIPVDIGSAWLMYYKDNKAEQVYEVFLDVRKNCVQQEDPLNDYGITETDYSTANSFHAFGKGKLTSEQSENLLNTLWVGRNGYEDFGTKMRGKLRRGKDRSYEDVMDEFIKKVNPTADEQHFLRTMENDQVTTTFGANPKQVFIKDSFYFSDESMLHMGGSLGHLIQEYAKCEKVSGNIAKYVTLNALVTEINVGKQYVSINYISEDKKKQIKAKKVLITVPLGVLKNEDIFFDPPLPRWKKNAIESLGFGVLDKWIGYWHDDVVVPWDLEKTTWISLIEDDAYITAHPFKSFFNEYKTNGNHKILTGIIGGDLALQIEDLSDSEIHNRAMASLKSMYPNSTIPNPNEFKVSRWGQKENFRGAYSIPSDGQMRNSGVLAKNIDDKLYFAGEATAGEWYGLVSGAYLSGINAAKEILGN
mmetsp:Transcript_39/g.87  ORF Transcript_39/g.87 Transcript_39/m.87 type:complete len:762 (-) Transcript_39:134-2419(-)|eukprot:CAMPEP_0113301550 /NCGR_PEP_ID=MMETSP0010_2-20120614/2735_1 /TAXON_ID=216773 ORGANISM="Corethron hystrix, Strain 308" /NCGR_SAMPLE_ID=MMETSP0010_2 /ASSEMBLY_ACC=CAM_ASM_000155 /LENGTH=761 /DNA_ID=CAMNT_0000155197 /DNA_START=19 /DNA_END=2304 /DNA_ORIENTATION=- /assembly_acc=CAM_ASM_000155